MLSFYNSKTKESSIGFNSIMPNPLSRGLAVSNLFYTGSFYASEKFGFLNKLFELWGVLSCI
jgi:hypothetical protein